MMRRPQANPTARTTAAALPTTSQTTTARTAATARTTTAALCAGVLLLAGLVGGCGHSSTGNDASAVRDVPLTHVMVEWVPGSPMAEYSDQGWAVYASGPGEILIRLVGSSTCPPEPAATFDPASGTLAVVDTSHYVGICTTDAEIHDFIARSAGLPAGTNPEDLTVTYEGDNLPRIPDSE